MTKIKNKQSQDVKPDKNQAVLQKKEQVKQPEKKKNKISKVNSGSISMYLAEIGKFEPLPPQREVELAICIQDGDELAMKELVEANLRFVVSVAKKYQGNGLSLADIINEGNMGLIKAAKRFDHTRGFKFISYAVWWIRQSILQALAEQSRIVRLPLNKIGSINKINKMYALLEQSNERAPSAEEIAKELDMTVNDVKESMKNSGRHLSMDAPLVEGEDSNLYDVLRSGESPNPDRELIHESLRTEIERALETLTPREADVVRLYFGLGDQHPMTLEEIGETFDLTRERVRQIKEKAIRRLKHTSRSKILKTYLG